MLGYTVLYKTFYLDKDPTWCKADGISFTIIDSIIGTSNDITGLLKTYSVVDYNFDTGVYKAGKDFTLVGPVVSGGTFYVKNHSCAPTTIKSGLDFIINGKKFVPTGFNAYWMGLHENGTIPTFTQIDNIFSIALKLKANTIRSHTLGFSSGGPQTLQFSDSPFEIIDYAFLKAKETGIKLILPLTDSYNYYHGNYGDFCDGNKEAFFTNGTYRARFLEFVARYLNHVNKFTNIAIKDSREVLFFELGNELGNYRPQATSIATPTVEWMNAVLEFIKERTSTMVLDCCDECVEQVNSLDVPFDAHSMHIYWDDRKRLNNMLRSMAPVILGEISSTMDEAYLKSIEPLVQGTIMWGIYPDGLTHDDGYTMNWGDSRLLMWSNHFRRMQGLKEVMSL